MYYIIYLFILGEDYYYSFILKINFYYVIYNYFGWYIMYQKFKRNPVQKSTPRTIPNNKTFISSNTMSNTTLSISKKLYNKSDIITSSKLLKIPKTQSCIQTPSQTILSNNTYIISDSNLNSKQNNTNIDNMRDIQNTMRDIQNTMRDTISDNISDVRAEIKNLEYKICKNEQNRKNETFDVKCTKIHTIIENLTFNSCLICEDTGKSITIFGNHSSKSILICDLTGKIDIPNISITNDDAIYGHITLFDSKTIFNGIVFISNEELHYAFTNRPLMQLGTPFKGIISIYIKIEK